VPPSRAKIFFTQNAICGPIALMETLGLSGPPAPKDSFFRRLFWPSADSADADALGQQGFWLCLILAVISVVTAAFQGHLILGVLFGIFYFLCGVGVREHDVVAALAVAGVYLVNITAISLVLKTAPGILTVFIELLLIANVRGCWIASKWSKTGDPDLIPARLNETWQDKLVDQMPARVWPRLRIVFYALSVVVLLLTIAGAVKTVTHPPPFPSDLAPVIVKG
jgi:hypothetical protein